MEYLSLPLQGLLTGTFIIALMLMCRSLNRTNRRIQLFEADLSSLKTTLPAASAPVTDKLRVSPVTDVKVHQVGAASHNAVVSVFAAPDLELATNKFKASSDAVMTKLDRIETLVDTLPCKITS